MSSLSAVATAVAGEGQVQGDQNGGSTLLVQQHEMSVASPSNPGTVVLRDTSSILGVSMYACQCYPSTVFKHEEVVANKEIFFETLNKFHTVLGTRLTKKGRKDKERAAEVKTFEESIAGALAEAVATVEGAENFTLKSRGKKKSNLKAKFKSLAEGSLMSEGEGNSAGDEYRADGGQKFV